MDSSDDELATNDTTTTPFRATKHVVSTLKPAKAKANGRPPSVPVAGPSSSKPAATTAQKTRPRKKRTPSPVLEIGEDGEEEDAEAGVEVGHARSGGQEEPIMIDVEPSEVETSEVPVRPMRGTRSKRAPSREPEATAPPKATHTQQRGKGKAATRRQPSPTVMEIDDTENTQGEESDVFAQPSAPVSRKEKQKANAASAAVTEKEFVRLQKENERLKTQIEELTRHRNNMAGQLDELVNLRHTEAEENLEQLKQHYESRIQAQEEAIAELTSSSDLVNALRLRGKTSSLHFLSHEAVEKEHIPFRTEIERLKGIIEKNGKNAVDSQQRVRQLENTVKTLQSDLKVEIDNSKKMANTHTHKSLKSDELKHGWVTKLYEDMTNFLVISVKEDEVGDLSGEPEFIYVCVYSTSESKGAGSGLTFSLRIFKADNEAGERDDKCLYTPMDLEHETEEFVQGLGFLSDTFTFWKAQMEVFYERLKSTMSDISAPPEEEEG